LEIDPYFYERKKKLHQIRTDVHNGKMKLLTQEESDKEIELFFKELEKKIKSQKNINSMQKVRNSISMEKKICEKLWNYLGAELSRVNCKLLYNTNKPRKFSLIFKKGDKVNETINSNYLDPKRNYIKIYQQS